ncbi:MAG: serine/threonine-protein phosphatase [Alphaproteobacteria bacterium]|nr:serine/threonine-protein phosphatase [Alphaproteobacteria bacterium]
MSEPLLRCQSGVASHAGCVRGDNEDAFHADDAAGLWAVADGMGGHANGEWASAAIVEQLAAFAASVSFEAGCAEIAELIYQANRRIFEEGAARGTQMGSTVVALHASGSRFSVFWVGDSRAYLLRDRRLHRISRDHSQVQTMIDRGLLAPEEAAGHPMGHILARAVGVEAKVEVDVVADEVAPGDTFLLCSDGLHGYVGEEAIAAALAHASVQGAAESLIAMTLDAGAPDNVTVVAIRFAEATLLDFSTGAGA